MNVGREELLDVEDLDLVLDVEGFRECERHGDLVVAGDDHRTQPGFDVLFALTQERFAWVRGDMDRDIADSEVSGTFMGFVVLGRGAMHDRLGGEDQLEFCADEVL